MKSRAIHISRFITIFSLLLIPAGFLPGQSITTHVRINWNPSEQVRVSETETVQLISFEGSSNLSDEFGTLPVFRKRFPLNVSREATDATLVNAVYEALQPGVVNALRDAGRIGGEIRVDRSVEGERGKNFLAVSFMPIRKNRLTGAFERLVSADLRITCIPKDAGSALKSVKSYAPHSALSQGTWYKMTVNATGIYKITANDLKTMGVNISSIDPRNIRIMGNGGGMLPESNAVPRVDDLMENAIFVYGEEDGIFNDGDYILFYAESPDGWKYNPSTHTFNHSKNVYSDFTCYFLSTDNGPGRRVQAEPSSQQTATETVDRFIDYAFYELDNMNLIKSGREWYDNAIFDITRERTYSFSFPNVDGSIPAIVKVDAASRSTSGPTSFTVLAYNQAVMDLPIPATSSDWLAEYAKKANKSGSFTPAGNQVDIGLRYNKNSNEAIGYLNYIEVNVMRQMKMAGSQMAFRSLFSLGQNKVCEYHVVAGGQSLVFWDVTDPSQVKSMTPLLTEDSYVFRQAKTDSLIHEFIAFNGNEFKTILSATRIENQDLHGTGLVDYVIVTHPNFISQAVELGQFHLEHDNFQVLITTPEKIYNEFSSGVQDITAIRDFMKMLYDRAGREHAPKHLLLLGDASYDYKERIPNNTNYIPTFESVESLDPVDSYVTDDYFVLLDENEGQGAAGALDMGVGRFPVQTVEDAASAVEKIRHYCENSDTVKNDWRNVISFVAEDWDNNLHLNQTEEMVNIIENNHKEYNIDKIYVDAYPAIPTPGGLRNPEVNDAINKRMAKGALLMNYTGHGGELGWAHERVLEIPDIKSWTNINNMPAFVTATCEFSRFDDPNFISAGEWVFLNPLGGGIALFTTTRPTFAGSNSALTSNFYNNAFVKTDGRFPKMGDLIMNAKNATGGSANSRKFILLGDPALQLAYPQYNVVTTSITDGYGVNLPDTLKALSEVTITGEVRDDADALMTGFNGTVYPTVYDKSSQILTLGNTGGPTTTFNLRKNIIYKGKVQVAGGIFSFTFMVPKDIAYNYGIGRISYYASSPETDANGYDLNIVVGGYNNSAGTDDKGPEIEPYMNNTDFTPGGITDQNPYLYAVIRDTSGINTVGNGIGHDITAILDNNSQEARILNDYYVSDVNTFRSGIIRYPYTNLSDGEHTITIKAWDVYNNSSEATISFTVVSSDQFTVQHLMNYPNPVYDHTTFAFECNQTSAWLNAEITIYSITGRLVKTINEQFFADGYRTAQINWDGSTDGGARLFTGTYIYRLKVTLPNGSIVQQSSKLILFH